jgi:hypothetical protein
VTIRGAARPLPNLCLLAALSAGFGCGGSGAQDAGVDAADGGPDGGGDVQAPDGGDDGGGGGDGALLWPWCPDPSAYIGGPWTYQARVDERALYCAVNMGATVEEDLTLKARLRLVPGTYALPWEDGPYALWLPACLELPGGVGSQFSGAGSLAVDIEAYGEGSHASFLLEQPVSAGGSPWAITLDVSQYAYQGAPPELPLSDWLTSTAAGGEIYLFLRLSNAQLAYPWTLVPCLPAHTSRRVSRVTFDRGWMEVWHDPVDDLPSGGGGPAVFQRGTGELDGVAFDQRDYFRLAHLIAHHNWGGTFLVMFDAPIGAACGIKLCIPSVDGGGPELGAWTVDCSPAVLEALAGLSVQP